MAQWILKASGRVVPRRSLRPLKVDELHSPVEIKKRELFDELIKRRWGTPMTPPNTQQPKVFEYQVNSLIVNKATSTRIKLQVQEFKLQVQELQVSSTSYKFQDQDRKEA